MIACCHSGYPWLGPIAVCFICNMPVAMILRRFTELDAALSFSKTITASSTCIKKRFIQLDHTLLVSYLTFREIILQISKIHRDISTATAQTDYELICTDILTGSPIPKTSELLRTAAQAFVCFDYAAIKLQGRVDCPRSSCILAALGSALLLESLIPLRQSSH